MTKTTDHLGYDAYANSLWTRIEAALNKDVGDKELGDDPLVVGIFGEWGAGKSQLLKLILEKANGLKDQKVAWRERDGGFDLTVPVFFQPWKYENEEHLLVPLMLHIYAALKATLKRAQNIEDKASQAATAATTAFKENLPAIVDQLDKNFGTLVDGVAEVLNDVHPLLGKVLGGLVKFGAKKVSDKASEKKQHMRINSGLSYKNDGRFYYEMNEALAAITRPNKTDQHALKVEYAHPIRINFVIFIDDLDRCLPEKAVGTLELIKTIFNVESFAFVLALDEEVIERGIGHRYQAYNFAGKKPEMPITGFEYLEKIVHLPFRLPALSESQAREFLSYYELTIETDLSKCWFQPIKPVENGGLSDEAAHIGAVKLEAQVDFTDLALCAFDAYVPRKLIRLVELLHQTAAIARDERKRPMPRYLSEKIDSRVLFALILIQLFQPELFRIMRRRLTAFPFLLEAFTPTATTTTTAAATTPTSAGFTNPDLSNSDLWKWAIGTSPQSALPAGHSTVVGALNPYEAALQQMALIQNDTERYKAQQVRLPSAVQLLEHRAVQRHTFDLLKLMLKLRRDGVATGLYMPDYFGFLAQQSTLPSTITTPIFSTAPDTRTKFNLPNVQRVFDLWISKSDADNASFANDFVEGQAISAGSASSLLNLATEWLNAQPNERKSKQERLLKGFERLAPALAKEDRFQFWQLVEDLNPIPTDVNVPTPAPKLAALYADVRYLLGQDTRFIDTGDKPLFLLKERFANNNEKAEPISGFVRVEGGKFTMGHEADKADNPPREIDLDAAPFYMARTLTTVDQYGAFVKAGGYDDKALLDTLWDKQGLAWLDGEDGKGTEDWYKRMLELRPKELRKRPFNWDEQQTIGVRPIWGVTWFEARAYARWLNLQLKDEIASHEALSGYQITLPAEAYWERAARQDALQANTNKGSELIYPWGMDDGKPENRANIEKSEIKRASASVGVSAVGVFSPNSLGLLDLSGNVWEWQNNLYQGNKDTFEPLAKDRNLVSKEKWEDSDLVALRGGSWILNPGHAWVSFRRGVHPGRWGSSIGFRVMLSLAKLKAAT